MKTNILLLFGLLILSSGCKQERAHKTTESAPKTIEEYTEVIVKEVQKVILATDQQLRDYQPQLLELPAEEGRQPQTLKLWTEGGNPVKVTASEPDDSGQMTGLSSFYFANNELFFATQPYAQFIFIGPELKYWLNENWQAVKVPEQDRKEREKILLEQASYYLKLFVD